MQWTSQTMVCVYVRNAGSLLGGRAALLSCGGRSTAVDRCVDPRRLPAWGLPTSCPFAFPAAPPTAGSSLRKIGLKLDAKQPPAAQKWVAPLIKQAISKQADLDRIMTFPKGSPQKTGCKLRSFTYRKLCVPKARACAAQLRKGWRRAPGGSHTGCVCVRRLTAAAHLGIS